MPENLKDYDLGRRGFVAASVAAGLATAASVSAAELEVVETDVEIKTPDGTCDAAFIHPKNGSYAGVLLWPDAFGLRPVTRTMGRRLAAQGYSVLVPNPFYRVSKAPFSDASSFNFQNPADMAKLQPLMASVNAAGAAEKDAVAYIGFLDSQKEVNKSKKIGTQGYCMGGPLVMKTAATVPDRVGAAASFHGGGLVTEKPDSPHLLAPKIKAHMYFGIAANDDMKQPEAKDKLKAAFEAAHNPAKIEVYSMSQHGWCMSDMPSGTGMPIYNKPDAERAWAELTALYKKSLAESGRAVVRVELPLCLLCFCTGAAAQSNSSPADCGTPELILQRYVAALGGEAAIGQVQTLVVQARESEPHTFHPASTAHTSFRFEWRAPDRVAVKQSYLLSRTTFIFDGTAWSDFVGRVSHNEDRTPPQRRKLSSDYPYNDYPNFMMFRVVADPLLLAARKDLYAGFQSRPEKGRPGVCAVQANGTDQWIAPRHDVLYFDATSGLLKTWEIQLGAPGRTIYMHFQFDDYRQTGPVKTPFWIYFDFYKATFRVTKVTVNPPLADKDFTPK